MEVKFSVYLYRRVYVMIPGDVYNCGLFLSITIFVMQHLINTEPVSQKVTLRKTRAYIRTIAHNFDSIPRDVEGV